MSDPLRKVRPGDPLRIKAETFNTFIDVAAAYKARALQIAREATGDSHDPDVILVKNTTDVPLGQFAPIYYTEPIVLPADNLTEFKQRIAFKVWPAGTLNRRNAAVMLDTVPPGAIGRAVVSGVVPVRLGVISEYHTHAREHGNIFLSSFEGNAQILWVDEPDPERPEEPRWAIVRLSNHAAPFLLARIIESHPTYTLPGGEPRPLAIYRALPDEPDPNGHYETIDVRVLHEAGDGVLEDTDIVLHARVRFLHGVHWTGRIVWIRLLSDLYQIVSPGVYLWSNAVAKESFMFNGLVELFQEGPIVEAYSYTTIAEGTQCMVLFDDQRQKFVIFAQACPPPPEE